MTWEKHTYQGCGDHVCGPEAEGMPLSRDFPTGDMCTGPVPSERPPSDTDVSCLCNWGFKMEGLQGHQKFNATGKVDMHCC